MLYSQITEDTVKLLKDFINSRTDIDLSSVTVLSSSSKNPQEHNMKISGIISH